MKAWWLVPAALVLLGLVPVVAGGTRLAELATGTDITAENARFVAAPGPSSFPARFVGGITVGIARRDGSWFRSGFWQH